MSQKEITDEGHMWQAKVKSLKKDIQCVAARYANLENIHEESREQGAKT